MRVSPDLVGQSACYYATRLREHGTTARGVDWNSQASQELRFGQLLRLVEHEPVTLLDYGCGYGALLDYLERQGRGFDSYQGFDVADEMIDRARQRHGRRPHCRFTTNSAELQPARYTLASGVFNVKQRTPPEIWHEYVLAILDHLAELSTEGFAFNVLTMDSDRDRRRADLYYADPIFMLEHCRRRYSRWVALLQDYGLYEFSMIVRKRGGAMWRGL